MNIIKSAHAVVCTAAAGFTLATGSALAQVPNPSFSVLGHIQELEIADADLGDPLAKGLVVVNGLRITLPRNLLITMPGQSLTVNDLFRGPHPFNPDGSLKPAVKPSGLALKDRNLTATPPLIAPAVPFEAEVIGNVVNGEYIAAVMRISQGALNVGEGFIQSIDYTKGELRVGSDPSLGAGAVVTTARVRINDPSGEYGRPNKVKFGAGPNVIDERFSSDPGNAPIAAETGYPMCIAKVAPPGIDPDCPHTNRPTDLAVRRYTCGNALTIDPTAALHSGCNPTKKVPLSEGDFIAYSGMLSEEAPGSGNWFVAAHAVGAKLGIYTSPGANPAYVFIEEALVGALGRPFPGIDQEETSRFHLVGFTTDPTRLVDVFVLDHLADGSEVERRLTTLTPSPVAQVGRIRVTLPAKANFLPVTRDVRIRIANHTSIKLGGLDSGQYTAPVAEYIYPENTRFGQFKNPVSVPTENFCFLKNGGGPLTTLGRTGAVPVVGPLLPFPLSGHPNAQPRADGTLACP